MDELLLSYLAGIMDGDGYFTIKRNTYAIRVTKDSKNPSYSEKVGIKQVVPDAIKIIHGNFGGYYFEEKQNKGKNLFGVQLSNLKANFFIRAIFPYLILKKKQASILLKLRDLIQKGKTKKIISIHKDRWGKDTKFTRYCLSDEEILERELLIKELKDLNDSRYDITHRPKFIPEIAKELFKGG